MESSEYYILFGLAGTTYAVRSDEVKRMDMVEQITPVPNAPPAVAGVAFLRGQVIPVINLRVRFGFPPADYNLQTRLIVVRTAGRIVGLIADTAREFVKIPETSIQPPPEGISNLRGRYLAGIAAIGDRLVLILNIDEVINPADIMTAAPERAEIQEGSRDEK